MIISRRDQRNGIGKNKGLWPKINLDVRGKSIFGTEQVGQAIRYLPTYVPKVRIHGHMQSLKEE